MSDLDITVLELTRERDALLVENRELQEATAYNRKMASDYGEELLNLRTENRELKEGRISELMTTPEGPDPFLTDLLSYHQEQVVNLRGRTYMMPPVPNGECKRTGSYENPESVHATNEWIAFHRRAVGVLEGLV